MDTLDKDAQLDKDATSLLGSFSLSRCGNGAMLMLQVIRGRATMHCLSIRLPGSGRGGESIDG